jgi:signal transduction histidine kinase/CheY-like chemotaxis protein
MCEMELANGTVIHVIERRTPDGGVVGVFRDITTAERALARAKGDAEAANLAKSQFLSAMSHEIRTPLNGVLGMNSLLARTALDDVQRSYVRTIRSSGKALLTLIDDILDLSKIEAGKLDLAQADFEPRRLLDEVHASLAIRAQEKQLALKVHCAADVPAVLLGDESRLRQVLFNLIGNAVKFTERGAVQVRLGLGTLDDGTPSLAIDVCDSGIGIAPDVLPTLFQRFTQADSGIARRYGGSGLGLAISRELVQLMGGAIEVHTEVGRGSTFSLRVPLRLGSVARVVRESSQFDAGADFTASLRILVAEDNEVNQLVIRAVLEQMGHHCEVVADGAQAIERVARSPYDLVLMDIQMPHVDGLQATRRIRALPGDRGRVPIVALTANAMAEERATYLEAGMNDHVSKPVDTKSLAQTIARVFAEAA